MLSGTLPIEARTFLPSIITIKRRLPSQLLAEDYTGVLTFILNNMRYRSIVNLNTHHISKLMGCFFVSFFLIIIPIKIKKNGMVTRVC